MAVSALVARMDVDHMEYLRAAPAGQVEWVSSPKHAATFETLREELTEATERHPLPMAPMTSATGARPSLTGTPH